MGAMYTWVQLAALIGVCLTFGLIVLYALWPGNRSQFDEAAQVPFKEDSEP
ncbi:MAG: cbb3-type cytochrome c oxidase subunit 3 [Rhizobiales bacterium]|nr:cbb3-type cytochrome c oxidase subunit 3 [Hyphomicrobiales bacterium]